MAYGRRIQGARRSDAPDARPRWRPWRRIGRFAAAAALVLAVIAVGVWLTFAFGTPYGLPLIVVLGAGVLALVASWRIGPSIPAATVVAIGFTAMYIVGPFWASYTLLAHEGRTIIATVSKVDSEPDRHGLTYTDWLTDAYGHPIAQPLLTYGPPQPQEVGDPIRVVTDPNGRLNTEPPHVVHASWPLLVTLGGVLLMLAGLAMAARARPPGTDGGWRPVSGGRTSRPASARTQPARRRARGR
jgi:hypothetical protein